MLEALAQSWALDIAPLEARHASNREMSLLTSKGWVPSLETLSTQFICKAVNRASARGNTSLHGKNVKKAKSDEKKESQVRKKKNAGGGGAWRAYVHQKCKGVKFGGAALTELAKSYKALSPQEKQLYIDAGKAATLAKKEGFASFYEPEESNQKKSQRQQKPYLLPGDVTESGAIVSTDAAMKFELGPSLQYEGTDFFLDGFEALKKQGKSKPTDDTADVWDQSLDQHFSEQEQQKLLELEKSVSDASSASFLYQGGHDEAADSLRNRGSTSQQLASLDWAPPAGQLCQDRVKSLESKAESFVSRM